MIYIIKVNSHTLND